MLHIWICNSNRCCYWLVKYPIGLQKSVKIRLILASDAKRVYHLYHLYCNMLSVKCLYEWNNQEDGVQRYVLSRTHLNVFFSFCVPSHPYHMSVSVHVSNGCSHRDENVRHCLASQTLGCEQVCLQQEEHLNTELRKDNGSGTSEAVSRPLFKSVAFFFVRRWCRGHTRSGFGET